MAETTGRQFIYSALIFTAVISATFFMISASLPEGDSDFNEYNTTFNKFETIAAQSEEIQEPLKDTNKITGIAILDKLISASWGSLKLVWNSFETMVTLITQMGSTFGLPGWFTGLIISFIGITIAFAMMAAWFKWNI